MPPEGKASVIIAAVDETATLPGVLAQAARLRPAEVIVVANGPDDGVARIAAAAGARVIRHARRVGHDVGRALGAAAASGDTLLFLDADLPLAAGELLPFLQATAEGVDLALNRIDPYIQPAARSHPVNAAKRFLTAVLQRPDLGYASLTAMPHALSRRAVEALGADALAVPPVALARAVQAGLVVAAVHPVDVVGPNARRPGVNLGRSSPVEQLILGDHLEAVSWLLAQERSSRGPFGDLGRQRDLLRQ
ncbi:MAG TPA: glycosyltransferase [Symbiobacteriaceae bacterium]|nr:glycosyltransferase [Symbiobacteriaceae bacterium]